MKRLFNLKTLTTATVLTVGATLASGSASAGCHVEIPCYWKTVIVYEQIEQPVVHWVKKYTDCGQAYLEKVVTYDVVSVPVKKRIKVCH